jgi:molybdenum cofactor cytidylyltransferase
MRNVGAIILAAGGSSRFGQAKQLLHFQGESLVRRAVHAAIGARCDPVIVVVGEARSHIETELGGTPAIIVENTKWEQGLGTSIRSGLSQLLESEPELDAVVMVACDQPFVDAKIIASLIRRHEYSGKPIAACSYANTVGVPALFDRSVFEALLSLPDDSGAKALIGARATDVARVEFEPGSIDIDTPADFEQIKSEG